MFKGPLYNTEKYEVWYWGRRMKKMEIAQTNEKYIRSLFHTGHVLKDANGKEYSAEEIIHPTNRV